MPSKPGTAEPVEPFPSFFLVVRSIFSKQRVLEPVEPLEVTLDVRGEEKTIFFNARNRQFRCLYFSHFKEGYEILVARSIDHFLPDEGVLVDAGSNWGYFPLLFASRESFDGKIHAFEPMPETFDDLRLMIEQAGLEEWIKPWQVALADKIGIATMKETRHSGLAHITEGKDGLEVRLGKIDGFGWDRVDVMKVDVEGFELPVFRGSVETLDRCQPVLIFESGIDHGAAEGALEPLRFLEGKGYRLFRPDLDKENDKLQFYEVKADARSDHPAYMNIVAVPESRFSEIEDVIAG